MQPVAVYARTLPVALARVWENVLDWEHLPWLHQATFGHVRLLERRADGWRAETSLRASRRPEPFVVDVAIARDTREYHSRTVAGPGAGRDVVTRVVPLGARTTRVEVAFLAPDLPAASREAAGAAWVGLYTRLWDEDEAMMLRRQALLDGTLRPGCGTAVVDGRTIRFGTTCPHLGGPLDDEPITAGCVTCPWHGYRFDLRTGRSADGRGLALDTPPA
jgi:phenylpropionate dioxygenase-like ring-hydroxylating dioxygenase large terminal subunit